MDVDTIYCGECSAVMGTFAPESIPQVVTSPPYGDARNYKGYVFKYKLVLKELYRVLMPGGVLCWVTQSIGAQKCLEELYMLHLGFSVYPLIYFKNGVRPVGNPNYYSLEHEPVLVAYKGNPPRAWHPLQTPTKYANTGRNVRYRQKNGELKTTNYFSSASTHKRGTVWKIEVGYQKSTKDDFAYEHPAIMAESLAKKLIQSWSNPGDIILDPMCGSGTTLAMAAKLNRHFVGIDCAQEYCDLSKRRVDKYVNNTRLF